MTRKDIGTTTTTKQALGGSKSVTGRLLNYRDVMAALACSESAVRRLAKGGAIARKYYPGVGYRYDAASVDRFIREEGI